MESRHDSYVTCEGGIFIMLACPYQGALVLCTIQNERFGQQFALADEFFRRKTVERAVEPIATTLLMPGPQQFLRLTNMIKKIAVQAFRP